MALSYLDLIESDHIATVLLEVESDINGLSAFDMALQYNLLDFVKNNRIERIANSLQQEYMFLDPKNKDRAFKINPLSVKLIWDKLWSKSFYFTPLGLFSTQFVLYSIYLLLFTWLSAQQFRVYDPMSMQEVIFWVFNIGMCLFLPVCVCDHKFVWSFLGYVLYEVFQIVDEGIHVYLQQASNYFDFVICGLFISSLSIRLTVWARKYHFGSGGYAYECCLDCADSAANACADLTENSIFVILWGINTIALWRRLSFYCVLSSELGPMIRMIQRMMVDIIVFLEIIGIIFIGVLFSSCASQICCGHF